MPLRSVFSPLRIRPILASVLFLFAAFLFSTGPAQKDDPAFFAGMFILVALAVIPLVAPRGSDSIDAARQKEELMRTRELVEQQKKTAWMLVRRDLELTRANENLRALDQMKTDFVSVVTHQLRTPLSAIRWTISMLLNGDFGRLTDEQRTFLMKAYESNNRMINLIRDMVLVDHIESGKLAISSYLTTSLPDLLENLLVELQPLAKDKRVELIFQRPDPPYPPARIDSANLRAVLQNLIENAVKYTPIGGSVTIACSTDHSGALSLSVADTGIGIPKEEQPRIFTRFFRASNARKKETDGSGLGLFIAKKILQKYKGDIRFESKEGSGTTFYVTLPTASEPSKA